jgi:hypothetical protein
MWKKVAMLQGLENTGSKNLRNAGTSINSYTTLSSQYRITISTVLIL